MTARELAERYDLPRSAWERLINEWIFDLRDRMMLCMRLLDGLTLDEISEKMNMPVDTVKRRIRKAQTKVFAKAGA